MPVRQARHGAGGLVPVEVKEEVVVGQRAYALAAPVDAPSLELLYRVEGEQLVPVTDPEEEEEATAALMRGAARPGEPLVLDLADGATRRLRLMATVRLEGREYLVATEEEGPGELLLRREADGRLALASPDERARVQAHWQATVRGFEPGPGAGPEPALDAGLAMLADLELHLTRFPPGARGSREYQDMSMAARELRARLMEHTGIPADGDDDGP